MYLKFCKLPDLAGHDCDFIVPIGSTEQHGPFLPFGTDTFVIDSILKFIERKLPETVILPTLEYSCSREHEGYRGTVWLTERTLHSVLSDVCSSIEPWARSITLMTAHGGNIEALERFVAQNGGMVGCVPLVYLRLDDEGANDAFASAVNGECDEHAGNSEISLMCSIQPDLVTVPGTNCPKVPVVEPWATGRLVDKSADGIADPNPVWVIDARLGRLIRNVLERGALRGMKSILKRGGREPSREESQEREPCASA